VRERERYREFMERIEREREGEEQETKISNGGSLAYSSAATRGEGTRIALSGARTREMERPRERREE
jgi:hypothetical protein